MMSTMHFTMTEKRENFARDATVKEWKSWCRLCAKADAQYINIFSAQCQQPMSGDNSRTKIKLGTIIEEFFRVHVEQNEELPHLLCTECFSVLTYFIKFGDHVKRVQQMYNELQSFPDNTKLNLQLLCRKYGVFKEQSLMPQTLLEVSSSVSIPPVERIFVADLTATLTAQSSNIVVKNEKIADEVQTEIFSHEFEMKAEFQDPIGNDTDKGLCREQNTQMNEDVFSSGNEDKDFVVDLEKLKDQECQQLYAKSDHVKSQTIIVSSEKRSKECNYACNKCSERFQRNSSYRIHMKKHKVVEPAFTCSQCSRSYKTESKLQRHTEMHRSSPKKLTFFKTERAFICEVCGEAMRTKVALREHKLTHTDYAPFECKVCGKCFKQKARLRKHMDIHGDKHICAECGLQLSSRATLSSHVLVHSDVMQHKCDYCGRAFKRAKTLKNHLIAHTGLRPYSCDFCGKTFSTGPSCRFHKKNMHAKELAELEASGSKSYTKNIPKLAVLKAVTRAATCSTTGALDSVVSSKGTKEAKDDNTDVNSISTNSDMFSNISQQTSPNTGSKYRLVEKINIG